MLNAGILATNLTLKKEASWPAFAKDVEQFVNNCDECSQIKSTPRNTEDKWPEETVPWTRRVHMDDAVVPNVGLFLILVDTRSGWPEVIKVKDRSAETTVNALRVVFSRQGIPLTLVSDNAAEFCSNELESWLLKVGCRPYKTPPYHPQSNGIAERMVRTIKTAIRAWKESFGKFENANELQSIATRNQKQVSC